MYRSFLLLIILVITSYSIIAQPCVGGTNSYNIDFSGNPENSYDVSNEIRAGQCCGIAGPDVCVEFNVATDSNIIGLILEVTAGNLPPGDNYYYLDCSDSALIGDTLCITGSGPHRITFCAADFGTNDFKISQTGQNYVSKDIDVPGFCVDTMYIHGVKESTVTWNSIYPGVSGAYNGYLDCSNGCDTVLVKTLAIPLAPDSVLFEVSGELLGSCSGAPEYKDTITVRFYPDFPGFVHNLDKCIRDSANFTYTFNNPAITETSWSWDFGDGNSSADENPVHLYSDTGTYNVKLVVSSNSNCIDSISKNVRIMFLPVLDFNAIDTCFQYPYPTIFENKSTLDGDFAMNWYWNFGDGKTSTDENSKNLYGGEIYAKVLLKVETVNGCVDSLEKQIHIGRRPYSKFDFNDVCFGEPTVFNDKTENHAGSAFSLDWQFGDSATSSAKHPMHEYSEGGLYNVKLISSNVAGCKDSIEQVVTVYNLPKADYTTDKTCLNEIAEFYDQSTSTDGNIERWYWDFGHNNSTSTIPDPIYNFGPAPYYQIRLSVETEHGCVDTLESTLAIKALPRPGTLILDTIVYAGDQVKIVSNSLDAHEWHWDFGDGTGQSNEISPLYTYQEIGRYFIELAVYNYNGCWDWAWAYINVHLPPQIPNAFSPNGDGLNDFLVVEGGPYKQMEFKIYNEWGELVFESHEQGKGWNGTNNGISQPVGSYLFSFTGVSIEDHKYSEIGNVMLIR